MDVLILALVLAFAGGIVGALMGALANFILCSLALVIGIAAGISGATLDAAGGLAWGVFLGPHVGFAGGAAAAAYARRIGALEDGKDILTPLIGIEKPTVWLMGGGFGALGYLINVLIAPLAHNAFNSIAVTIVIVALISKLLFDSPRLIDRAPDHVRSNGGRFSYRHSIAWLLWARSPLQLTVLGLAVGAWSGGAALLFLSNSTAAPMATLVGFAFSVASLMFVVVGLRFPVTHHIALTAAVATVASGGNLLWGVAWGVIAAFVAHWLAQTVLVFGRTYIDPPSMAIAVCSFAVTGLVPAPFIEASSPYLPTAIIVVALGFALAHRGRVVTAPVATESV
jgi:hypothetical protein